jgi:hypothetical protein
MNDFYRKKYFKYESFSMQIDEILNKYFKSIKICTPYDIDSIIILSKKDMKMDFEIEIVVESCTQKKGFIQPGYTKFILTMDNSLDTPKTFQKLMMASIYEE